MAIKHLRSADFAAETEGAALALVDFWADWCGPCRMLSPVVDEVASERTDIKVGKINIDEELELAKSYRIMSIPSLIVFKDGEAINKSRGVISKEELLSLLPA